MRHRIALAGFASFLLAGCLFDYHEERLAGPYSLVAVDEEDQLTLCNRVTSHVCADRVGPTVVMAGENERYIVVSRRPYSDKEHRTVGEEQFFYVDRRADGPAVNVNESTKGPFSRAAFSSLGARLGFPPMHAVHG